MKKHLTNAAYGVIDYASYPLGMLLVAPIVLHKLGAAEYGIWTISTSVISIGGIVASGFCDANIRRVAKLRGTGEKQLMLQTVRSMLGINLVLGLLLAVLVWIAAPYGAQRIAVSHPAQVHECLVTLRIASILILFRAVESVGVSTQRAFESFRSSVQIASAVRLLTLGTAAALVLSGMGTVSILVGTAVYLVLGTVLQLREVQRLLDADTLWPVFQKEETRDLLQVGVFTWLQAIGGLIFGQIDRVLLGVSLGAAAVAPYTLCVQFTQPIFGGTASALQFLFPYLSGRVGTVSTAELKRILLKAFLCNLALVVCGAGLIQLFGVRLIRFWAGPAVAKSAGAILPLIVTGASLTGMSVTGIYALLALGLFRMVAGISLAARAAMLGLMAYLLHHGGLHGLATARLLYGFLSLLLYFPLVKYLESATETKRLRPSIGLACELQEGSKP